MERRMSFHRQHPQSAPGWQVHLGFPPCVEKLGHWIHLSSPLTGDPRGCVAPSLILGGVTKVKCILQGESPGAPLILLGVGTPSVRNEFITKATVV